MDIRQIQLGKTASDGDAQNHLTEHVEVDPPSPSEEIVNYPGRSLWISLKDNCGGDIMRGS